jgi:hypothetical protein
VRILGLVSFANQQPQKQQHFFFIIIILFSAGGAGGRTPGPPCLPVISGPRWPPGRSPRRRAAASSGRRAPRAPPLQPATMAGAWHCVVRAAGMERTAFCEGVHGARAPEGWGLGQPGCMYAGLLSVAGILLQAHTDAPPRRTDAPSALNCFSASAFSSAVPVACHLSGWQTSALTLYAALISCSGAPRDGHGNNNIAWQL